MKLSVLVPVFNEERTVAMALKSILNVPLTCDVEVIVVDDGSTDDTPALLADLADPRLSVLTHPRNRGKGAAVRTAVDAATGSHLVIVDADLEYSADDLLPLVAPVVAGQASVVYGTRRFTSNTAYSFWYVMGNKAVTLAANVLFNAYISDLETCYKLMPVELYRSLDVGSSGFGVEAEVTGKLLRRGIRPYEVPISYTARGRAEGKKLTWRDGVAALAILARERARSAGRA